MYAHIDGIVAEKNADSLVIDCGGVGYELICSRATLGSAPRVGERMKCFTILSVREDAMELFGFATREEKALYEKLRAVSGIGPRTALNILSSLSVRELSIAIVTGDVNALSRAPGVGKKTAQRIVLELKEKIDNSALEGAGSMPLPDMAVSAVAEAVEALMALGYTAQDAQRAVAAVSDSADTVDGLVLMALRGMDRG
ncbi:MAG: Holliday junction branch migration protein RuvA [Candidatus Fimadaptatus sp.]